ncbi:MAG: family 10 glycosylhydrolase [Armatimonadota bacterium]
MRLGTWLHFLPGTKEEIDSVVAGLSARGITTLIASFKNWTGPTFYPSDVAYTEPGFEDGGLLAYMIERCHAHGMEFEAWTCTFTEAGPSKLIDEHPACRAMGTEGAYRVEGGNGEGWACPARDLTQDYELAICREMLERYPDVDGLHLDYIRYSSTDTCYCAACQAEFSEQYGFDLLNDVMPGGSEGKAFDAYVRWRCGHIRRFVEKASALTKAHNMRLTAAVFPYYPSIMYDMGQDWVDWCRNGLLDAVYPMNYNWSDVMVGRYTDLATSMLTGANVLHCQGLGLKADMTPADIRNLGQAALNHGAAGLIFFEARTLLAQPEDVLAPFVGAGV